MDKISILDYVVPYFGNRQSEPYGKLEVEINGEKHVVPFGEKENRDGRIFVKVTEEREIRNVGSLYSPKFDFVTATPKLEEQDMTQFYAAVYCCRATRDVQICKGDFNAEGADLNDDIWKDCPDAEVFIGFFSGTNTEDIRAQVAEQEGCKKSSILLIPARTKPQDTELEYMLRVAAEADFDLGELPTKQLRALWTAYCFHKNLDVDTQGYDKALQNCGLWSWRKAALSGAPTTCLTSTWLPPLSEEKGTKRIGGHPRSSLFVCKLGVCMGDPYPANGRRSPCTQPNNTLNYLFLLCIPCPYTPIKDINT